MGEGDKKKKMVRKVSKKMTVDVLKCSDLKRAIKGTIKAHVKDVDLAKRLEHALADEIAYNDGGGGNVGVA